MGLELIETFFCVSISLQIFFLFFEKKTHADPNLAFFFFLFMFHAFQEYMYL